MKSVYLFGAGRADGDRGQRDLLGGKGANLAEMTRLGLPVPPGFTLTTEICRYFYENRMKYPDALEAEVDAAIGAIESLVGAQFGSESNPLLVSVRSGAPISMPGMMDTVLNLGLNDKTVVGLAKLSNDERFAYDSYRRFIQMYGEVVLGASSHQFERLLSDTKVAAGVDSDNELGPSELQELVQQFKKMIEIDRGVEFPQSPKEQLWGAIGAVFNSWMSSRAISYRRIHKISETLGTAVNIQAMVFGNMGEDCATGVCFTRDPSTGEKRFFGEYLSNAQGEDVVSGIRTPLPLNRESANDVNATTMEQYFPELYQQLVELYQRLEAHYHDMQDIEFTIQKGQLYLLQTRDGKRSASAAVRIAVDFVDEGLIDEDEAIRRVSTQQIEQLLHPRLDPRVNKDVIAKGLPASPGAASGEVVFSSADAENLGRAGKEVVLVRHETSPEDIAGMDAARGILTALGGMTSHAAVVARGMGTPCVAGCGSISIDYTNRLFKVGDKTVKQGDAITIDGSTGEVILGTVPTINSQVDHYFSRLMEWVDSRRKLRVRANAETLNDVKVALQFGAEGVGLCRTEHMFFEEKRIMAFREMILADTPELRQRALNNIFPFQKNDFVGIFREMADRPVTVRLLDPPLHEFLPKEEGEVNELAHALDVSPQVLKIKIRSLKELNPMLGHRGCRLGISHPEVYSMQVRAIAEAATELQQNEKISVHPEIMIPFVSSAEEFNLLKRLVCDVVKDVCEEFSVELSIKVGTMIEIPRAALVADEIAQEAEFFSFGTNDLTQMTLGLSRDDSGNFLPRYVENRLLPADPFMSIDRKGVGKLVEMATRDGRRTNPKLKIGICGEQGGDASTIAFCEDLGFEYVSCSPFRVPVARLAAAHASLIERDSSHGNR